jgi:hypothetical protein
VTVNLGKAEWKSAPRYRSLETTVINAHNFVQEFIDCLFFSSGGNAKTLMFVNISPADYNTDETVTSLT